MGRGRKRRLQIQAPNGDISSSAEPLRSSNDDDAHKPKLVGHSDHIESQPDVSDAGDKVKRRGKKRRNESMKNGIRDDVCESFVRDLVDEESMKKTEPGNGISISMPTRIQTAAEPAQPDNLVLRKLLRGPRYFDPPDQSWGSCYSCGEQGHRTADCSAERKKKPCFLCGSTEHTFKKCRKERDCSICKTGGHKAKDCPEKDIHKKNGFIDVKICLRCGGYGHDMFSCKNSYFPIDLKAIQCYICSGFGHLCCYASADHVSKEVSCYKCGGQGHTGLACARLAGETAGMSPALCYNCRQGGHFARECPHPLKNKSRSDTVNCAPSSCHGCGKEGHFLRDCPSSSKDAKSSDRDTSRRKRKIKSDEDGIPTVSMPRRDGSITEDSLVSLVPCKKDTPSKKEDNQVSEEPSESPRPSRKANNKNSKQSPVTRSGRKHQIQHLNSSGQTSGYPVYKNNYSQRSVALDSRGSTKPYHQSFPPSRFFNYMIRSVAQFYF